MNNSNYGYLSKNIVTQMMIDFSRLIAIKKKNKIKNQKYQNLKVKNKKKNLFNFFFIF